MQRLLLDDLKHWVKRPSRRPLILRGARQVGKTWLLRELGHLCFDQTILLDFERDPQLAQVFDGSLAPSALLPQLELLLNQRILPQKTLLIFDEIQACPNALRSLRYFYEELPELHVVAAGSLLEFALENFSFPVGRVEFMHLAPLNFAEFLLGLGKPALAKLLHEEPRALPIAVHNQLFSELSHYFKVGGFPASVLRYIETGSYHESHAVLGELTLGFRMDFASYRPRVEPQTMTEVLHRLAGTLGGQIIFTKLYDGVSQPTVKRAYQLLQAAGLLSECVSTTTPDLPLPQIGTAKRFKSFLVDIAFALHLRGVASEMNVEDGSALFRGAMSEQFVAQELLGQHGHLHYWARSRPATSELDFLIQGRNRVVPVEVKSAAAGRLRSMHQFLERYPDQGDGIVLSERPFERLPKQRLFFVPLYYAGSPGLLDLASW